jgi:hypothetical protein
MTAVQKVDLPAPAGPYIQHACQLLVADAEEVRKQRVGAGARVRVVPLPARRTCSWLLQATG